MEPGGASRPGAVECWPRPPPRPEARHGRSHLGAHRVALRAGISVLVPLLLLGDLDLDVIRGWWSLRSLTAIRWLIEHGFDPLEPGCEVDVLRSHL